MSKEKKRRPLPRGQKIARNLLLSGLLLCLAWSRMGYPLPTAEMEFRRMERSCLIPKSEIIFDTTRGEHTHWNVGREDRILTSVDGTELTLRGKHFVGVTEDAVISGLVSSGLFDREDRALSVYPLGEEPLLIPLGGGYYNLAAGYWVEEEHHPQGGVHYTYHNFNAMLLLNVPEEAAGLDLSLKRDWGEHPLECEVQSWDMGGGIWLIGLMDREDGVQVDDLARSIFCDLRLYDGGGALLWERSGSLPWPRWI